MDDTTSTTGPATSLLATHANHLAYLAHLAPHVDITAATARGYRYDFEGSYIATFQPVDQTNAVALLAAWDCPPLTLDEARERSALRSPDGQPVHIVWTAVQA